MKDFAEVLKHTAPVILLSGLVLLGAVSLAQATDYLWTGSTDNTWATGTNWSPNGTPGASDNVQIPVTINAPAITDARSLASLEVKLGAILHINNDTGSLSVSGDVNNAGTINLGATTAPGVAGDGTLTVTGRLLNTGVTNLGSSSYEGTLTLGRLNNVGLAPVTGTGTIRVIPSGAGNSAISVSGDWLSAGTFIVGDADVTMSGDGNLTHTSINGFGNLSVTGGTRTLTSGVVVTGTLGVSAGATLAAGGNDLEVAGKATITGNMTATGGTQTYLDELEISGTYNNGTNDVTVKISGVLDNNGTATMGSGTVTIFDTSASAFDNAAAAQFTSTSGNLSVGGGFTNNGTLNHNNGTITFTDSGTFTPGASNYYSIAKSGLGTTTSLPAGATSLTLLGGLTVSSGTFAADGNDTLTISGNISVGGVLSVPNALVLAPGSGTTQMFDPGTRTSTYGTVTKQSSGTTQLANHPLTTTGDVTISAGTFAMADQGLDIAGVLSVATGATLTDTTGTLEVAGDATVTGTFTTSGAATHLFSGNLAVPAGGRYDNGSSAVTVNVTGDVDNDGTMALGSGNVDFIGGASALNNAGVLTATSGNLNVVSEFTNSGTFNHNNGTLNLGGTANFTTGGAGVTFNNVIKKGTGTTTTLVGALTAAGMVGPESGTFALGANDATVGGISIGTDGTLTGTGTLSVSGDLTNQGSYSHTGTLKLTGTGTLTPGTSDFVVPLQTSGATTLAANSTFHFAGTTWSNTGSFTAGSGSTVKFSRSPGDQTLNLGTNVSFVNLETDNDGVITFTAPADLSGKFTIAGGATVKDLTPGDTYNFSSAVEINVAGTWTLTGSSGNHIKLWGPMVDANLDGVADDNPSGRWTLTVNSSGTVNLNYVDLRSSELVSHGGSINGKNVNYTVVSNGNLSPSWGPFDPVPVPVTQPDPSDPTQATLALVTTNPGASEATVPVGQTLNLKVQLTASQPVNGVSAYLSYDPSVLRPVDASNDDGLQPFSRGEFIGGLPFENSASDGILRYTEGNVTGNAQGTGTVATVSFEVLKAPADDTTLVSFLNDASRGLVTGVSSNGGTFVPTLQGFTLTVGNPSIPGDANTDGIVNLADFSILAAVFGTSDTRADFNADGLVNLADFSILAANFGKSADTVAAPAKQMADGAWLMAHGRFSGDLFEVRLTTNPQTRKRANVQTERSDLRAYSFQLDYDHNALELLGVTEGGALSDTLFMSQGDRVLSASRSGAGAGVLATLRFRVTGTAVVILRDVQVVDAQGNLSHLPDLSFNLQPSTFNLQPERTRLLANYPNPFNPETWIPFELAESADVRVRIFDATGRLVRTLELGRLPTGHYLDRTSAAYWDGRSDTGERVASGVYLYRLEAGEFSAVRRMMILK